MLVLPLVAALALASPPEVEPSSVLGLELWASRGEVQDALDRPRRVVSGTWIPWRWSKRFVDLHYGCEHRRCSSPALVVIVDEATTLLALGGPQAGDLAHAHGSGGLEDLLGLPREEVVASLGPAEILAASGDAEPARADRAVSVLLREFRDQGDVLLWTRGEERVGVCLDEAGRASAVGLWLPENAAIRRAACDDGDATACLWRGRALGPGRELEAMALVEPACHSGDVEACWAGIVAARAGGADLEDLHRLHLAACDHGFATSCKLLAWDLLERGEGDVEAVLDQGCVQGDAAACAIREGDIPLTPPRAVDLPAGFAATLEASGARFRLPPGFSVASEEVPEGAPLVIRAHAAPVEYRYYAIPIPPRAEEAAARMGKPLEEVLAAINDSGSEAPLRAILSTVTPHPMARVAPFPELAVRLEFDAEWGVTLAVPTHAHLGEEKAMAFLLHRDDLADLVIIALFDGSPEAWPWVVAGFHALRFEGPVGLP